MRARAAVAAQAGATVGGRMAALTAVWMAVLTAAAVRVVARAVRMEGAGLAAAATVAGASGTRCDNSSSTGRRRSSRR